MNITRISLTNLKNITKITFKSKGIKASKPSLQDSVELSLKTQYKAQSQKIWEEVQELIKSNPKGEVKTMELNGSKVQFFGDSIISEKTKEGKRRISTFTKQDDKYMPVRIVDGNIEYQFNEGELSQIKLAKNTLKY